MHRELGPETAPHRKPRSSADAYRRQAIEAITHAHGTTGQINLRPRRDRNHDVALNADSTWRRARSLTKPSTRSLVPSARSISIRPDRRSTLARARAVGL